MGHGDVGARVPDKTPFHLHHYVSVGVGVAGQPGPVGLGLPGGVRWSGVVWGQWVGDDTHCHHLTSIPTLPPSQCTHHLTVPVPRATTPLPPPHCHPGVWGGRTLGLKTDTDTAVDTDTDEGLNRCSYSRVH